MLTEIHTLSADEIDQAVAVWESSVRATHHFISEADIQIFKPLVRNGLESLEQRVAVHTLDGRVAGFLAAANGKIEMLFIHPDWRGGGAGRRLLEHAIGILGATWLDVNEQNGQALGFYRRMGFEVVGRSERDGLDKPFPLLHMRFQP